jgi:ATP-dependent Clp protease ATP-binding subunit ClpX
VLSQAETKDCLEFGFEPEIIGRLPVRVVCHPLTVSDLYEVLKTSEGTIIRQYEEAFAAYGIEVLFQDDALQRIAELAGNEQTGARALMTVCERVFRDIKFELPSTHVKRFVATKELVDDPAAALRKLLAEHQNEEKLVARQLVRDFAGRFKETHGLTLVFTGEAIEILIHRALAAATPVRDFCAQLFKDYQFGLKLIAQNTGQQEFVIDQAVVENPDKVLSDWVVLSYRAEARNSIPPADPN